MALAAMAGITTSPQLRESPETAKYQLPLFGCCGAGADSWVAVWASAGATEPRAMNANNAAQRTIRRIIEPPAAFFNFAQKC
jgi:hypothetical protein